MLYTIVHANRFSLIISLAIYSALTIICPIKYDDFSFDDASVN